MKYLIWGLGKSGIASLQLLKNQFDDEIYLFDDNDEVLNNFSNELPQYLDNENQNNIRIIKRLTKGFVSLLNVMIVSPAIDTDNQFVILAHEKGVRVISELQLGYENLGNNDLICLTGTNGKTTTVQLATLMLRYGNIEAKAVGNIGVPLCQELYKIRQQTNKKNTTYITQSNKKQKNNNDKYVFVCEVSSFQLQCCTSLRPKIACLLNISQDHINRHKSMQEYANIKYGIFKNQTSNDISILSSELDCSLNTNVYQFGFEKVKKGCYVKNGYIYFKNKLFAHKICKVADIKLLGKHNIKNVMCAIIIAKLYKVKNKDIVQAIKDFVPSKHRLQCVYKRENNYFYDDSKATNLDATINALTSFKGNKNFILILGGSDKGYEFDALFDNLPPNLVKIFVTGQVKDKIKIAYDNAKVYIPLELCDNLRSAVYLACKELKDNEDLLLSPACASFDEFRDYRERGEKFLKYIKDFYEEFKDENIKNN